MSDITFEQVALAFFATVLVFGIAPYAALEVWRIWRREKEEARRS